MEETIDPFLLAHRIRPYVFEIGGAQSPGSIRDQMLRACMLVDRAVELKLLSNDRRLLVVGAGAAGASAAIRAAKAGIETTLIEKENQPFNVQAESHTRWISPTQYDWPAIHWDENKFPWFGEPMPLPYSADYAKNLALAWKAALDDARAMYRDKFVFLQNTEVDKSQWVEVARSGEEIIRSFPVKDRLVEVYFLTNKGETNEDGTPKFTKSSANKYGMVIASVGTGKEQLSIPGSEFVGYSFWANDPFNSPRLGLGVVETPRVLIIGGGDGGLQDFLRIITGTRSAHHIYKSLPFGVQSILVNSGLVRDLIEKYAFTAEEQAQRSHIWNNRKQQDHYVLKQVDRNHENVIDTIVSDTKLWNSVCKAFGSMIMRSAMPGNIKLIHKCNHFKKSYGLNRFLALLINRYLNQHNIFPFLSNREITQIKGIGHNCGDPSECHGKDHSVSFEESKCGTPGDDQETLGNIPDEVYNVIIIRSGPRERKYYFAGSPITNPRHVLPYYLPQ